MKKITLAVFVIFILMGQTFSFVVEPAEAGGCSVSIINVNPPSGATIDDADVKFGKISVDITISWSVSIPLENITGYDSGFVVILEKAVWDETKNDWQYLSPTIYTAGKTTISNSPKTLTFGFDPTKKYLLNATIGVEYGDGQFDSGLLPDFKYCNSYFEYILDYHMKSELLLDASFTITPESPTINADVYFMSTSTSPNSNIIENKWYLDGKYLQAVGNSETWNSKLSKGTHTVELTVTDNLGYTDTESKTFTVRDITVNKPILTVSTDKTTYITHEKIIVNGKVTFGGTPLSHVDVNLKIQQQNGKVNIWPGPLTESDGTFKVEYEVPTTTLNTVPPNPETWIIEVTANPAEAEYGAVKESLTVQILPVYLKLHSIHLVQVAEVPVIKGTTYIAADREAGLRVLVSCPNLKGYTNAAKPLVTISLNIEGNGVTVKQVQKKATIGADYSAVDFTFTLSKGTYFLNIQVDPYNEFMDTIYSQELNMNHFFTSKEMKTLKIEYVPLYIQLNSNEKLSEFDSFCVEHSNFIKNVYPVPDSKLKCYEVTETLSPVLLTPTLSLQRWLLLKALSLRSYLTADKVVGVLPADTGWWGPGEEGYSSWSVPPFFYYTRSVLVKYGSNEGVTAHEIGHTLGLNRFPWNEEYVTDPFFGKEVNGLILKEGQIFNVTNEDEKVQAFGVGTGKVYCFMGNNPGGLSPSWVCNKTFSELFESLMDPPEKIVYVSGVIYENDTVLLDNWYIGKGEPDPIDVGTYTIQCVSSTRNVLYSTNFGGEIEDFLGFGFVIPCPEGTTSVLIKRGEQILKEVQPSENLPIVDLQFPNGGEILNGEQVISWSGNDYDGDQLAYSVLCSSNKGETWTVIEVELNETSCEVDFSGCPEGNQYLIRVIATDGFNTGEDTSETTFTVNSNNNSSIDILSIVGIIAVIILGVILSVLIIRRRSKKSKILLPPPPPPPPPQY